MTEKYTQHSQTKEVQPSSDTLAYVQRSDGRIMPMEIIAAEKDTHKTFDDNNNEVDDRLYTMVGTVPEWMTDQKTGEKVFGLPEKVIPGSLLTKEAQLALEEKLMDTLVQPSLTEPVARELGKVGILENRDYSHDSEFHIPAEVQRTK